MDINRLDISSRMSQAVVHGETIYLAGQVPVDWSANIEEQTRQVLAKIDTLLERVGSDKSRMLSAQIWLADIGEFENMNGVWESWIDKENPPARTTCGAKLAHEDIRVEITVVAAVGPQ